MNVKAALIHGDINMKLMLAAFGKKKNVCTTKEIFQTNL
jgi:hypothetical protein